jgi:hypothetical protein
MTAAARKQPMAQPSALEIFVGRCAARATAWQAGEISLPDAVDNCQQLAEALGLVIEFGQDEVQRHMAETFAKIVMTCKALQVRRRPVRRQAGCETSHDDDAARNG